MQRVHWVLRQTGIEDCIGDGVLSLSGCPAVTDSEVNSKRSDDIKRGEPPFAYQ